MKTRSIRSILALVIITAVISMTACKMKYKPLLSSEDGINFKEITLDEALETAKKENKPLFVFAHASWCPTCKQMESEVLVKKELGDSLNDNLLNVAIDIDSPAGKLLQRSYPIRATPTLLFFNADGSLKKKVEGSASSDELLAVAALFKK